MAHFQKKSRNRRWKPGVRNCRHIAPRFCFSNTAATSSGTQMFVRNMSSENSPYAWKIITVVLTIYWSKITAVVSGDPCHYHAVIVSRKINVLFPFPTCWLMGAITTCVTPDLLLPDAALHQPIRYSGERSRCSCLTDWHRYLTRLDVFLFPLGRISSRQ